MPQDIDALEDLIWRDIADARSSQAILNLFIQPLIRSSNHFGNRYAAVLNAIERSAIESGIAAVGRLLQQPTGSSECTLASYRNAVLKELRVKGPRRNESKHARRSLKQLSDRSFIRNLKGQQKRFADKILPARIQMVAHTVTQARRDNPLKNALSNLDDCINYLEEVHRTCHSALNDAGFPGKCMAATFEREAAELVARLTINL